MAMRENPDLVKLLASLLQGGDPRVGGTLPIGGKAYARGTPQGGDGQGLGSLRVEDAAHDAVMNYNESRLNDEEQRLGLQPGSTMAPNMDQLFRILNALQQRERR